MKLECNLVTLLDTGESACALAYVYVRMYVRTYIQVLALCTTTEDHVTGSGEFGAHVNWSMHCAGVGRHPGASDGCPTARPRGA